MLLVLHRDVTERVQMESVMSHIMQAQLEMLCDIFPRYGKGFHNPGMYGQIL